MPFISYLRHLLTARNEHSLHSPFLFDFYCTVIRGKNQPKVTDGFVLNNDIPRHRQRTYMRLIRTYFHDAVILSIGEPPVDVHKVAQGKIYRSKENVPGKIDLVMVNQAMGKDFITALPDLLPKLHTESMVAIEGIHASATSSHCWALLRQDPCFRQTMDFYRFGVLLLRDKQPRQHFRLRTW